MECFGVKHQLGTYWRGGGWCFTHITEVSANSPLLPLTGDQSLDGL